MNRVIRPLLNLKVGNILYYDDDNTKTFFEILAVDIDKDKVYLKVLTNFNCYAKGYQTWESYEYLIKYNTEYELIDNLESQSSNLQEIINTLTI